MPSRISQKRRKRAGKAMARFSSGATVEERTGVSTGKNTGVIIGKKGVFVGRTREGHPVLLKQDPVMKTVRYYAVHPNGRVVYARPVKKPATANSPTMSFSVLGGVAGVLLAGPLGAIVGSALVGALSALSNAQHKQAPSAFAEFEEQSDVESAAHG